MFDAISQVMYILAMKNSKLISTVFSAVAFFTLYSCGSTKIEPVQKIPVPVTEPEVPAVEEVPPVPEKKDEYEKSIGNVSVTKDTFEADKAEIMSIIKKLSTIMKDFDYESWLLYVDSESKAYWSRPANLKKAQSKLPVKGLQLKNLQDYFKYVFVGARIGREVTSIRYVSDSYVKAVQVTEEETSDFEEKYTVYYYFNKINGHWELHLPTIDE